jgi:RNAse (barnase) inhibitor barstar
MTTEPDQTAGLPEFVFDGASFEGLDGFFAAIAVTLGTTGWGKNLDAFNDILRGGFGTPEGGFILRWTHSDTSAQRLGWPETIRWLEKTLTTCHPANVARIQAKLQAARHGQGQTLYDTITAIITDHGPGGREPEDNVHLILC